MNCLLILQINVVYFFTFEKYLTWKNWTTAQQLFEKGDICKNKITVSLSGLAMLDHQTTKVSHFCICVIPLRGGKCVNRYLLSVIPKKDWTILRREIISISHLLKHFIILNKIYYIGILIFILLFYTARCTEKRISNVQITYFYET